MIVARLCRDSRDRLACEDRRAPPLAGAGRVGGARGRLPSASARGPAGARGARRLGRGDRIVPRRPASQAGVPRSFRRVRGRRRARAHLPRQPAVRRRAGHARGGDASPAVCPRGGRGEQPGRVDVREPRPPHDVLHRRPRHRPDRQHQQQLRARPPRRAARRAGARVREALNRGVSALDAAVRTVQTAGAAVVTSGLTVVVGFAGLLTTPLVETRSVGVGGLLVVGTAVLLATTFLPAMLAILGRNIDRPRWLARPLASIHAPSGWERWARFLLHRPWRAVAGGGLAVALLSFPLTQIRIGVPARNWFPPESESGQGLAELQEMGASGVIQPTRVVIQLPEGESALSPLRLRGLKTLSDSLRKDPGVKEVRGVATIRPGMSSLQLALFYSDSREVRERFAPFFNAYLSADNRTTLVDVIPADTVTLTGLMDVARRVRAVVAHRVRGLQGCEILVGGFAATSVDLQHHLLSRLPGVVALILGITALMLFVAFRSVLVPLKAVLLNCLSVSSAFGVTVLVFQHGYGGRLFGLDGPTEAIFVVVPVLIFATVFGLSMDYEVFLLTRMKEVFDKTGRNDHATMEGLSATASTITFAAAIMIAVFGVFAFSRVLAVQLVGFGLAMAVLFDATLIRMVLVPAIMHIAGRWNWWPGVRAPRQDDASGD